VLGAGLLGMVFGLPTLGYELMRGMRGVMENTHQLQIALVGPEMMRLGLMAILPVMAMGMIGAIAATMLQSRGLISAKGLKPQFSRINPASGIKRLLGPEGAIEFLRTLIKLAVICAALWWALGDPQELRMVLSLSPGDLLHRMMQASMDLFIAAVLAFAAIDRAGLPGGALSSFAPFAHDTPGIAGRSEGKRRRPPDQGPHSQFTDGARKAAHDDRSAQSCRHHHQPNPLCRSAGL